MREENPNRIRFQRRSRERERDREESNTVEMRQKRDAEMLKRNEQYPG